MPPSALPRPTLDVGIEYSDDQLASSFGFNAHFLRSAGGMVAVPQLNALLLMTHAPGDASFSYRDYWDGEILCYAGRGQKGDQQLNGQNRDVSENRRELWVFDYVRPFTRRFLGNATCRRTVWEPSKDRTGKERRSLRFELVFNDPRVTALVWSGKSRQLRRLTSQPFDAKRLPQAPAPGRSTRTPEEVAQILEKRNTGHHHLLVALEKALRACGWTAIEEMRSGFDLRAQRDNRTIIFEAKTVRLGDELVPVRSALSQLLEYRFFYGEPADGLCLAVDNPISDRRVRFMDAMGIGVLEFDGDKFIARGSQAEGLLRPLPHAST